MHMSYVIISLWTMDSWIPSAFQRCDHSLDTFCTALHKSLVDLPFWQSISNTKADAKNIAGRILWDVVMFIDIYDVMFDSGICWENKWCARLCPIFLAPGLFFFFFFWGQMWYFSGGIRLEPRSCFKGEILGVPGQQQHFLCLAWQGGTGAAPALSVFRLGFDERIRAWYKIWYIWDILMTSWVHHMAPRSTHFSLQVFRAGWVGLRYHLGSALAAVP